MCSYNTELQLNAQMCIDQAERYLSKFSRWVAKYVTQRSSLAMSIQSADVLGGGLTQADSTLVKVR